MGEKKVKLGILVIKFKDLPDDICDLISNFVLYRCPIPGYKKLKYRGKDAFTYSTIALNNSKCWDLYQQMKDPWSYGLRRLNGETQCNLFVIAGQQGTYEDLKAIRSGINPTTKDTTFAQWCQTRSIIFPKYRYISELELRDRGWYNDWLNNETQDKEGYIY